MSELEIPTAVAVLASGVTVAFFILLIWSMKRHRDPKLKVNCDSPIGELLPSLAGLTLGTVVQGNSVEVLENRAFFEVLNVPTTEPYLESPFYPEMACGGMVSDIAPIWIHEMVKRQG